MTIYFNIVNSQPQHDMEGRVQIILELHSTHINLNRTSMLLKSNDFSHIQRQIQNQVTSCQF